MGMLTPQTSKQVIQFVKRKNPTAYCSHDHAVSTVAKHVVIVVIVPGDQPPNAHPRIIVNYHSDNLIAVTSPLRSSCVYSSP